MKPTTRMPLPPDAYAGIALALAILLEWAVPLPILPRFIPLSPLTLIGFLVGLIGVALELTAARALRDADTTTKPNDAPTALVIRGAFSRSRNPFYIGIILLLLGFCLAASLDWAILTLPLFWLALDRFVVPHEERALETAFGDDYRAYAARVPRWLGRVKG